MAGGRGPAPTPHGAATTAELIGRLRDLRAWAGMSYRATHRELVRSRAARGVPERPVFDTVYRCFQPGRSRLDVELVVDIARVLLGGDVAADGWRQACEVALGRASIAAIVDVADRWPEDLATFSGRHTELDQITELAAGGGVVVICGMGGVGKTRLAVRAGHQLMTDGRFTDLQLAVDLRGYDPEWSPADPAAVLDGFLRHLGMPGEQIRQLDLAARTAALRQLLAGKRALVLLDNAANADQVSPLIAETHGCLTLITSRRALPNLAGTTQLVVDALNPTQSVDLLRQVCGPDRIDADSSAAKAIARSLGGLPLALDLVAARIRASPDWTLVDHHERLVRRRLDDAVNVSLRVSYDDLRPDQQRLFRLLALHPGDITVYAAAALTDARQAAVQEHLDQLVAANVLLQRSPGRYGFHDLVRVFAANLTHDHDAASARNAALRRLFDHYAYAASVAMDHYAPFDRVRRPHVPDPRTPTPQLADAETATAWLHAERANLIAVALYAADQGSPTHTGHQSATLARYLDATANFHDAEILHTRALLTADLTGTAAALRGLGTMHLHVGRYPQALDHFTRALRIVREIGDRAAEGHLLTDLGNVYWRSGRRLNAVEKFEAGLAIAAEVGDRFGQARARNSIGEVLLVSGDPAALDELQRVVEIHRADANRIGEAIALENLGCAYTRLGRYSEAVDPHQSALAIGREVGGGFLEGRVLTSLGRAYRGLGRHTLALDHHQQALDIGRDNGDRVLLAQALNGIGETLRSTNSPSRAAEHHQRALTIATEIGDALEQARAHHGIACALAVRGHHEVAQSHWQQALSLYSKLGARETEEIRTYLADLTL